MAWSAVEKPAMEACSQFSNDQAAFQQCIEREMGFTGQDL